MSRTDLPKTAGGYWIEFTFLPLADGGLFCHYRDITRLKEREEVPIGHSENRDHDTGYSQRMERLEHVRPWSREDEQEGERRIVEPGEQGTRVQRLARQGRVCDGTDHALHRTRWE